MRDPVHGEISRKYLDQLARDEAFNLLYSAAGALLAERDEFRSTNAFLRQTNQDVCDERLAFEDLLAALLLDLQCGRLPAEELIERVRKAVKDA